MIIRTNEKTKSIYSVVLPLTIKASYSPEGNRVKKSQKKSMKNAPSTSNRPGTGAKY